MKNENAKTIEMSEEDFENAISNAINNKTYTENVNPVGRFSFLK